jgi:RNA polymerase sigma-70 factor, ECF subfamily
VPGPAAARTARREEPLDPHLPDPVVGRADGLGPEQEALLADSVGLALLVVLDTLAPAERLAFVLHDLFVVPFGEVAPVPDADLGRQRAAVDAFLAAARDGDFDALLAVLDPDVVVRADNGPVPAGVARPALVNGTAGLVVASDGRPLSVMGFTVARGRIVEVDILVDPERLRRLDLAAAAG